MKSPGYIAIIVALGLLSGAAAAAESVLSVVGRAQLLGSWASSCSAGASPSNWIVTWYAGGSGTVRRRSLRGPGLPPLDGAIDSAEMLSPTLMRTRMRNDDPNWGNLNGKVYDVVLDMSGGTMRTVSSATGDGQAIIRDGKFVSNGSPSVLAQRCAK
jgi:hypothetical protein